MRELREFREAFPEFEREQAAVVGASADTLASNRRWAERLHLPYPLLSDPERTVGRTLGLVRRFGIGAWAVELFRRATLLVDIRGNVAAAWGDVKVRGHADRVLMAVRALRRLPPGPPDATPVSPS